MNKPGSSLKNEQRFPKTASQLIGWKSADPKFKLEKYGTYSKGKSTVTKSFKWPDEGVI